MRFFWIAACQYGFYQYERKSKTAMKPSFTHSDVTIVAPTIDRDHNFTQAVRSWLECLPQHIIIVTPEDAIESVVRALENIDTTRITVCSASASRPGKRLQLAAGIERATTKFIVLVDDDVSGDRQH
jgi:glycosyltransferase involved in cell wall biosynthesis